jgi:hypothetical protein
VLAELTDLVAELFDAQTKPRHRHGIEQGIVLPELVVAQRPPFAVGPSRHIGNDGMEVGVGLLVAVGVVLEQRDRKVAGLDGTLPAANLHPGLGKVLLGPAQGFPDGRGVGVEDPFVAAHQSEDRPAFRHRKGEIGPRPVRPVVTADAAPIRQHPLRTASNCRASTAPLSPSAAAPLPSHSPERSASARV